MHYLSAESISKSYGIRPLFSHLNFHLTEGDKIALIAKNGSGKTTLLKILAGQETPDEGSIWVHKDVTVVLFEQETTLDPNATVMECIFRHNHPVLNAIKNYEAAVETSDPQILNASIVQMDELGAWDFESKVKQILGKLNIHHLQQTTGSLSGGQKKRIALARTLIDAGFDHRHVLLIMDEPTNHLDIEMVEWLEHFLNKESLTLLLVTHDRYFLEDVCDEIWELDGGELFTYKGDYQNYLEKKTARLESEKASLSKHKNIYRKELEWMRKQPRARTVKSKARQDRFAEVEKLAHKQLEESKLQLQLKMNRLGGKVAELKKVYKQYGDKILLRGFDYTFKRGERIGIVGRNGTGKSTFLDLLLGILPPDSGKINIGDTIVFGYYSQKGLELKQDQRVIEYVKSIAENFPLEKGGSLSAAQFLELFLFDPEKQHTYISKLSGGEKRRLHLLSVLFRNPNFLILDEPTNDLDLPTLSVLEQFLSEYPGCLLIVSHDRYFMDRLVDHLFVFKGEGIIEDFPGNYTQYRLQEKSSENNQRENTQKEKNPDIVANSGNDENKRLSYKEKREFELLQKEIEALSTEKEKITAQLQQGSLPFEELDTLSKRFSVITTELDEKELRWLELSERPE
jgi:ATP-binding cassette subfamily F protein uup